MKKIITIAFAVVFTAFGAAPAFAQTGEPTPSDCVEADNITDQEVQDFCDSFVVGGDGVGVYPPVAGEGGEVPDTTTTTTLPVAGDGGPVDNPTLPATGGSGSSGILQGGALLLVAGAVFFVAARRRDTATA